MCILHDICILSLCTDNLFCDTASWNIIKGDWIYDPADCSLQNSDSGSGNIVWLGSDDGLIPNSDFIDDTFTLTVTMSLQSGSNAGLIFRTEETSTINNEGPTYYVGISSNDSVVFGTMDDGWNLRHIAAVPSGIDYDTVYTLSVHAKGIVYDVYLNGTLVMADIIGTEFSGGSFGVRTFKAPATFYSLEYQSMCPTETVFENVSNC